MNAFNFALAILDILIATSVIFAAGSKIRAAGKMHYIAPKEDAWCETRTRPMDFGKVDQFAKRCIWEDQGGRVSLNDVHDAYERWCVVQALKPFSPERFIETLYDLCTFAGIDIDDSAGTVFLIGVEIKL